VLPCGTVVRVHKTLRQSVGRNSAVLAIVGGAGAGALGQWAGGQGTRAQPLVGVDL
jgi:hypothetical protein